MPYTSISELPEHVKKYPEKKQRQWMHIWMSVYSKSHDEGHAFAAANACLSQNIEDADVESFIETMSYVETVESSEDPNAKVRNRGKCVFPSGSEKVKDNKDHFPINDIGQARNALARCMQYSSAPDWYSGSLEELQSSVRSAVHSAYPGVEITKKSEENMKTEEFKLKAKDIKSIETVETENGLLLKSVPVFKTGKYGTNEYDSKFIDEKMIGQFDPEEDIPFQADHSDSARDTLGYIRKLQRNDDLALADIEIIDDNAIARWRKGLLKKFSVGMYTATGKLREISAVAFPRVKEAVVHTEAVEDINKNKAGDNKMAEEKKAEELLREAAEVQTKLESERDTLKTQLSEKDTELKKLRDEIKKGRIDTLVTTLLSEGKITPAMKDKTVEFMSSLDDAGVDNFVAVLKDNKPVVEMGEAGGQKQKKDESKKSWADSHSAEECVREAESRAKKNATTYTEEYDKLFIVV